MSLKPRTLRAAGSCDGSPSRKQSRNQKVRYSGAEAPRRLKPNAAWFSCANYAEPHLRTKEGPLYVGRPRRAAQTK